MSNEIAHQSVVFLMKSRWNRRSILTPISSKRWSTALISSRVFDKCSSILCWTFLSDILTPWNDDNTWSGKYHVLILDDLIDFSNHLMGIDRGIDWKLMPFQTECRFFMVKVSFDSHAIGNEPSIWIKSHEIVDGIDWNVIDSNQWC